MSEPRTCPDCQGWSSDETGMEPCGRCDDTGVIEEPDDVFFHAIPKLDACDHDFQGFHPFEDGNGGEAVCTKCGMGAMAYTLSKGI